MKDIPIVVLLFIVGTVSAYFFFMGDIQKILLTAPVSQGSVATVPFSLLVRGSQSQVAYRINYVITSSEQLNELWKLVDAAGTPPDIDFASKQVVAVFAGQQPTAGYAIRVSRVVDSEKRLVSVTLQKPDTTCVVGQAITAPYEIVTLPATSLPFVHEDLSITDSC